MKEITTLFCALAVLVFFVLLTGCGNSKKESETGEIADNDAVDADIDNKELPECSPTSGTPCKDSSSGLVWSAKSLGNVMYQLAAYDYCDNLSEGGYSDWRLPSIDELRTLIKNCWKTYIGGECRVSLEGCRESSCENDACAGCSSDLSGKYSKLGDNEILWSASAPPDFTDCSWIVDFGDGGIKIDSSHWDFRTRCVRDDSGENSEDGENSDSVKGCFKVDGRLWSNSARMFWSEAVDYCDNLNECGISDWHLPTISELRTLILNSAATEPGGECGVTDTCLSYEDCYSEICWSIESHGNGLYSKIGDMYWFWSYSAPPDEPDYAWGVDFYNGSVENLNKNTYYYKGSNVRCVSQGKDEDQNGCASGEYLCNNSRSLRCEGGFWIPDKYCENGCDPSTGKCR